MLGNNNKTTCFFDLILNFFEMIFFNQHAQMAIQNRQHTVVVFFFQKKFINTLFNRRLE